MASNNVSAVSAFIQGAPPGELADVVNDIRALTEDGGDATLIEKARPAFRKYNEEQLATVKLPGGGGGGGGKNVLISAYNSLDGERDEDGPRRYFDVESRSSWAFDHVTQKASDVQSYTLDSEHSDLITSLSKTLAAHAREHYPPSTTTHAVIPTPTNPSTIVILLVSNKYSPTNFWTGRLRTTYLYETAGGTLSGTLRCDVHYYEDGNVRLQSSKTVPTTTIASSSSSSSATGTASEITRTIARVEKAWQEEMNRGFGRLSEGEFKSLRRQLPVTRQKVEWEKVGGYRAGKEIGGGRR